MSDGPLTAAPIEGASSASEFGSVPPYDYRVWPDPEGLSGPPFPEGLLTDAQADLMCSGMKQFNFYSSGMRAGLSRALWCIATRGAKGCAEGHKVAVIVPNRDALSITRQQFLLDLEPLFATQPTGNVFTVKGREPGSQGLLRLSHLESGLIDLTQRVDLLMIDGADKIPGFYAIWHDQILPLATEWGMRVCVFGRAKGANNGHGRLCLEYRDSENGRHVVCPASLNPTTIPESLEKRRAAISPEQAAQDLDGEILIGQQLELTQRQQVIGEEETFLQWCDRLAQDGLEVDGKSFRLDDRPAMRWIYEQVPSTKEEAFGKRIVLMKCAQVGFTVMEMLAMIYMALKFSPAKVGMFLPQQNLASMKSSQRFMPIVRTVPDAHKLMTENPSGTKGGEGNILTRNMGKSVFYFLWTTGKATTESMPMDVLSFDEVQEMSVADMEKTQERLSASDIRWTLMGSTANWPDSDIHHFYKKGSQHRFWTKCPTCGHEQILDEHFPACIKMKPGVDKVGDQFIERNDYRYVCMECDCVIHDTQIGEWKPELEGWKPDDPEAAPMSIHFPQTLSPTISAREMIESFHSATSMKNFYNRKLGKPYTDPSQVPVTLEILNECARIGMELGVEWENSGEHTFMGLDQGGLFNVAIIAKRLPTGHMAVIHVEECYGDDPFDRCSELMYQYGVDVCVVEHLPNYNDSKRFAGRHPGKVFLASYQRMQDDMIRWGDSVPSSADRKTSEEDRDRYTVSLDQYKCMDVATSRITKHICVFPDPDALVQELKVKERSVESNLVPILRDRVFLHLTRVALVAEQKDDDTRTWNRYVKKIGIDPHFAFAFMLLNIAWSRAHGTTMFLNPDAVQPNEPSAVAQKVKQAMPGLPDGVVAMLNLPDGVCGRCIAFEEGRCTERNFLVGERDPGCEMFIGKATN